MSLSTLHGLGAIEVSTTAPVTAVIGGITASDTNLGNEFTGQVENGEIYPTYRSVSAQKPRISWTSRDIATVLSTLGSGGICITSDETYTGLTAYYRKRSCTGTASGSVHRAVTMANGIAFPSRLSCSHQGNATIDCVALGVSADGSTSCLTNIDSAALPTVVSATRDDQYTLYAASLAGTAVTGFTGFDLDFGVAGRTVGSQSETQDTLATVESVMPMLTLRGLTIPWWKDSGGLIATLGNTITLANTYISIKKRGVSAGTAEHVKITFNGIATVENIAASGTGDATIEVKFSLHSSDGSTAPIGVSVNTTV